MIPCRQLSSNLLVSSDSQAGSTWLQFSRERLPEAGLLELGSRRGCCALWVSVFLSPLAVRSLKRPGRPVGGCLSGDVARVCLCVPGSPRLGPARAYLLQRAPCPSCDLASSRRAQSAPSLCVLFVFSPSHVLLLFILKGFWTCRHIRMCQSIPVYSLPRDLTQVSRELGPRAPAACSHSGTPFRITGWPVVRLDLFWVFPWRSQPGHVWIVQSFLSCLLVWVCLMFPHNEMQFMHFVWKITETMLSSQGFCL